MTATVSAGPGMPGGPEPTPTPAAPAPAKPLAVQAYEPPTLVQMVEANVAAAAQQARTALEARFVIAQHVPRDWGRVAKRLEDACARPRFAEEARYAVPRGKQQIEGLSIRFAEEAVRALGNIMVEAAVISDSLERRIVRVIATDLEANITWPFEVVVEKTVERHTVKAGTEVVGTRETSDGKVVKIVRATDDEVQQKQWILVSKAARNGVLRFLPADVQEDALARISATLTKAARDGATITRMCEAFERLGVTRAHLEDLIGHGLEAMTGEEYRLLRGAYQALADGETTWETVARERGPTRAKKEVPLAPAAKVHDGYGADKTKAETRETAKVQATEGPAREEIRMEDKPPVPRRRPPTDEEALYEEAAGDVAQPADGAPSTGTAPAATAEPAPGEPPQRRQGDAAEAGDAYEEEI